MLLAASCCSSAVAKIAGSFDAAGSGALNLSSLHTAVKVWVVGQAARANLDLLLGWLHAGRPGRQAGRGSWLLLLAFFFVSLVVSFSFWPLVFFGTCTASAGSWPKAGTAPLGTGRQAVTGGALPFSSSQAAVCRGHQVHLLQPGRAGLRQSRELVGQRVRMAVMMTGLQQDHHRLHCLQGVCCELENDASARIVLQLYRCCCLVALGQRAAPRCVAGTQHRSRGEPGPAVPALTLHWLSGGLNRQC